MQFVLAFLFFLIMEHFVAFYMKMLEAFSYLCAKLDSTYIHVIMHTFLHLQFFYSVGFVLQYLITGAKDGSIKVWDDRGNIKIIFVGHLKSVNTLAVYPFGTYIMSGSSDNSIRVWSLDTADEVDRIDTKEAVLGLGTIVGKNDLYSFGRRSIELWKIEHIHSVFATVG